MSVFVSFIFNYVRLDLSKQLLHPHFKAGLHSDGEGCLTAALLPPSQLPFELLQTLPCVVVVQHPFNRCNTRGPLLLQVSRWLLVLSGHSARIFV